MYAAAYKPESRNSNRTPDMILPSSYFQAGIPPQQAVFRSRNSTISHEQYRQHTAELAHALRETGADTAALMTEDNYLFAVALMAALHAGCKVIIPGNLSAATAETLQGEGALVVSDLALRGALPICGHGNCGHPLPPFDAATAHLWFYTSGSSGEPKRIHRTFANLEAELRMLAGILPEGESAIVYSTALFHHAYGIIFGFLLPLSRGLLCDTAEFLSPADFLARVDSLTPPNHLAWIVTTPAFIRVWAANTDICRLSPRPLRIQCAGAPLPLAAAQQIHAQTGADFVEIFGSSETGVVAHRNPLATQEWSPFAGVCITPSADTGMRIDSPCIPPGESAHPGDNAELLPNGRFLLLPRRDNVVKIADKRISLSEIEQYLEASELVEQAAALKLEGKTRPISAAVVVPTPAGLELLRHQGSQGCRKALGAHLAHHLPPVLIPKKWRFVGEIPTNTRGKTDREALLRIFDSKAYLPFLTPLATSATDIMARALYLKDSPWVAGHFPGHPIIPGVVMLRTLSALTTQYWGMRIDRIQRLKFNAPVSPGDELYISLRRKNERLDVLLSRTPDGSEPTCKGICRLAHVSHLEAGGNMHA